MDLTGVLVLAYATVCAVWTLCDAHREAVRVLDDDRPSAIPAMRDGHR